MKLILFILACIVEAVILIIAFFVGAVYEDTRVQEAYRSGKPYNLGDEVVRIIPWDDSRRKP